MTWRPLALASRSNPSRFGYEGAARLINCYAEATGEDAKSTFALYATEGLKAKFRPGAGRTWAMIATDNRIYGVTGALLWSRDINGIQTDIETLPIEGPVFFARNRRNPSTEVGLVTMANGQYRVITGLTVVLVTLNLLGPPTSLDVHDGYFIMSMNFNRYQITGEDNATSLSLTAFGKAQRAPDEIIRVLAFETDIILFGSTSIEWHQNDPSATASFPYVAGPHISVGLIGPLAVARLDRDVVWVASDGTVRRVTGYGGDVISTPAVQRDIGRVAGSDIVVFGWNAKAIGRRFMAITSPEWTWVYDLQDGTWHERQSYGRANWRISTVFEWQNQLLAGDIETGDIYEMSGDYYDENGALFVMTAQLPPMDGFPNPASVHAVRIDVVPGVGVTSPVSAHNSAPLVMMSYSDDGGRNWSTERTAEIGRAGATNARASWWRLGMVRRNGRTFRFSVSAAVARCFQSVAVKVRPHSQG